MPRAPVLILLALAACSSERDRNATAAELAAAADPMPTWAVQEVLECDFAVELPQPVARHEDRPAPTPEIVTYLYTGSKHARTGLAAACTVFPHGMELPPTEEALRKMTQRHELSVADLHGGVRDRRFEPDGDGLHYTLTMQDLTVLEGRAFLVGLQVHDVWGSHQNAPAQREELARLWRSYVRR